LETCGRADDALANLKRKLRYREKTKQSMEDRKAKAEAKLQEGEGALDEEMKEQQLVNVCPVSSFTLDSKLMCRRKNSGSKIVKPRYIEIACKINNKLCSETSIGLDLISTPR
jgi:hypothetical protein